MTPHLAKRRIIIDIDNTVATVTINRPEAHNCIDYDLLIELHANLRALSENDTVRVVILAGAGASFSAGIDLTAVAEGRMPESAYALFEETVWLLETMPKPTIAAIHSNCIGAGLQMALACDLRVAEPGARFHLPAAREGLIPGVSPHRLWRFVGVALARRMVLFGEVVLADAALKHGMVDQLAEVRRPAPGTDEGVSAAASVLRASRRCARALQETLPTASFQMCKEMLSLPRSGERAYLDDYLRDQARCRAHSDHHRAAADWLRQRRARA